MERSLEELVVVARGNTEREWAELALVLTARGIEHRRLNSPRGQWELAVPASDARPAVDEIEAYRVERSRPVTAPAPLRDLPNAWAGVAAYAAVLMLVAICAEQYFLGIDWGVAGRLVAGRIFDGEWWRPVTALTLHADLAHLAGNLAFGSFFGYFIGRYFGPGIGWCAILCSGVLGNVLNAAIQSADHRSVGASTAVFGALGLLTAHAWRRGSAQSSWRRFAPIAAGIGLLAFTGTGGENTDIFAHLTGFCAGFGIGAVLERIELPRAASAQAVFGGVACLLLALAWAAALAWGAGLELLDG